MLDALLDAVLVLRPVRDADGVIVDALIEQSNEAWRSLLDWRGEDPRGHRLLRERPAFADRFPAFVRVMETREPFRGTVPLPGDATRMLNVVYSANGDRLVVVAREVTDTLRAEKALAEGEERYRQLFDSSPAGIVLISPDGCISRANREQARMYGYDSPDDLIGVHATLLVAPPSRALATEILRRRLSGEEIPPVEYQLIRRDGSTFYGETSATILRDRDDAVSGYICTTLDTTERKLAEEALRKSEERFRLFFERTPDYAYLVSPDKRLIDVNMSALAALGYSREELVGQPLETIYAAESVVRMSELFEQWKATGQLTNEEMAIVTKSGERRIVLLSAAMIRDDAGRPLHSLSVQRDITDRQRAEKALRASEEQYRRFVEEDVAAVFVTTADGRLVLCNSAFARIAGFASAADALSAHVPDFYPSPEARRAWLAELKERGRLDLREIEWRRLDGTPVHAIMTASGEFDEAGELVGIRGHFIDITERKRLEEQLLLSQKMEAIGQLAGGVAHDFNNLLTAIRGYTELARQGMAAEEPRRADLDEVIANADRAAALVRQLLAFGRRQVLEPRVVDPAAVVENLATMLRRLLGEHIQLATRAAPGLGHVKVDQSQLEQVIVNLTVNAADAMPDGGALTVELSNVEIDPTYAAAHAEVTPGPCVLLAVSDTGVGIDAVTRAHIFEPFFTTKEPGKGTGMGLATVYGIVKQSGGFINVYSEPGRGTTFRIYLPRVGEELTAAAETVAAHPAPDGTETILLVEDDPAVRGFARRALEAHGYCVLEAADGADALALAAAHPDPIALLITDVIMPGLQGHQLAEQLRASRTELRTIFMSGFAENSVIHHGVLDQSVAFLPKPFGADALCGAVRRALDGQAR